MANVLPGRPPAPEPPKRKKKRSQRNKPNKRSKKKTGLLQIRIEPTVLAKLYAAADRERYKHFSEWARFHLIYASTMKDTREDRDQLIKSRHEMNELIGYVDRNPDRLSPEYLKAEIARINDDVCEVIDAMLRRVYP